MARIKTLRMSGRRFGWKVGNSQIGVKEYFDKLNVLVLKLLAKNAEIALWEQETGKYDTDKFEKCLEILDRQKASIEKRLRAVEARTWTPMESFIIDRPAEDEVNLETFVRGHILRRIENELETSTERETAEPQAVRAEIASV